MTITVDGTYENGVLRPDQPLELPENSRVRISITTELPASYTDLGTLRALRAEVLKDGRAPLDWAGIEDEVAGPTGRLAREPVILTFVDAGVLIAAARGGTEQAERALAILEGSSPASSRPVSS